MQGMRPQSLLVILSAVVIGGILLLKGYIKSKPEFKNQQTEVMKKILNECSSLGPVTDPKFIACEERVRGLNN
jgi:hypothetical protein